MGHVTTQVEDGSLTKQAMDRAAIPFYPNHPDNLHCMLAVYRSIYDALLGEKLDWVSLENLTGFEPNKAAWSVKILTHIAQFLDIKMIEPFDYLRYSTEGEEYLATLFNPEELEWQLQHTNLLEISPLIPRFLEAVHPICRRGTTEDIDAMLDEGRLVFVILNSNSLNDRAGFVSHAVLILSKTADTYLFHDPGLPPRPYREEKKSKVYAAMGGELSTSEVTGFKVR